MSTSAIGRPASTVMHSSEPVRVAVIDGDTGFVHVLGRRLEHAGWRVRVGTSTLPVEELMAARLNALVIDLDTLGPVGWEYLERVCQALPALAVIVSSGRSTVAQRVRGLRLGADDWVTKPCHPEELVARLEAVVRRGRRARAPVVETGPLVAGELEIRADQFQAYVAGRGADLTRREFEVLELLAGVEGKVIPREEIYQRVWGYAMVHGDRSVDVFVRKLRQKIEKLSPGWRYIHTHFGIGYRFQAEPAVGDESAPAAADSPAVETAPPPPAVAGTDRSALGAPE